MPRKKNKRKGEVEKNSKNNFYINNSDLSTHIAKEAEKNLKELLEVNESYQKNKSILSELKDKKDKSIWGINSQNNKKSET